jgi:putative NADH-flavin reductase
VTRRPDEFPFTHPRLIIAKVDVHDSQAVYRAVEGSEAVLSSLGVPFTSKPIMVYSGGVSAIIAAMSRLGVKRIAVVSSTTVEPHHHAEGGFILNRIMQPMVSATIGKTTYADMRAMEDILRRSDLDWTVVRSAGLFEAGHVSFYQVSDGQLDGVFTSREDLADCLLAQVSDSRFVRKTIEVTTSEGAPTLWQMIRREAFKKS